MGVAKDSGALEHAWEHLPQWGTCHVTVTFLYNVAASLLCFIVWELALLGWAS